jgi:xylan 1,4-beta-xylosidase
MKFRWRPTIAAAITLALALPAIAQNIAPQQINIDTHAPTTPFPHFWEQMFGSPHANMALRAQYLHDLRQVKHATGLDYVRAHGIFDDGNGVYTEDQHGNPVYNFQLVDQIYDGLLKNGVRPMVEISFMPKQLAFNPYDLHVFWYHPNVSPPKSWKKWDGLIQAFARHLIQRYGIKEVSTWYFEVWNEPNIDFWGGIPRQQSYFQLYAHTARALKSVSPRLRVGGPATAAASWVPQFLDYMHAHNVPVDFVSTHGYADDTVWNLFHTHQNIPPDQRVCKAIEKVDRQIAASPMPHLPLYWTEWNVPGHYQDRDTTFVGPALANTVRQCDGKVRMMSFWTFTDDDFQEGGPIDHPFSGHFGLIAEGGIKKPSFYDFSLLHQLGDVRLANPAKDLLVTRTKNGTLAIALWNLVDVGPNTVAKNGNVQGPTRHITLNFTGLPANATATISRVDNQHGNTLALYRKMGSPQYPTMAQVAQLNKDSALPPPTTHKIVNGRLKLTLEPDALLLVKVKASGK